MHNVYAESGPQGENDDKGQCAWLTVGSFKLWCLTTGELQLLERNHDGLADADRETQHKGPQLLIPFADGVDPTPQQWRIAPVTFGEDECGHFRCAGDIPDGVYDVAQGQKASDSETDRASPAQLVRCVARTNHEDKIDCANCFRNVVDLWHRVRPLGLEPQPKVLDDIRAAGQRPEAVCQREGVELPRDENTLEDGKVQFSNWGASLFFNPLARPLLLPCGEVEGRRVARGIRVEEKADSATGTAKTKSKMKSHRHEDMPPLPCIPL